MASRMVAIVLSGAVMMNFALIIEACWWIGVPTSGLSDRAIQAFVAAVFLLSYFIFLKSGRYKELCAEFAKLEKPVQSKITALTWLYVFFSLSAPILLSLIGRKWLGTP